MNAPAPQTPNPGPQTSLLGRELRPLLRLGQSWLTLVIVFASLGLALLVSYQVRPGYDLPIDSNLMNRTGLPFFDDSLYGVEKLNDQNGNLIYPYRWTKPSFSLTLPGVAHQPFTLTISISGARPADQPPAVITMTMGAAGQERPLAVFTPELKLREYTFLIPAEAIDNGNFRVLVSSNGFHPASDNRDLGIILNRTRVTPVPSAGFILPPLSTSLWLALALALLLLGIARLGWGRRTLLGVGLGFVLASALWLIFDRLFLTVAAPTIWQALIAAYIGLVIADNILRLLRQYRGELEDALPTAEAGRPWAVRAARWLLTIFFAAFALRLGGQLHPQTFVVDLFFHVHRVQAVLSGSLLFKTYSAEWGGQATYYPPSAYIPMLPFTWLLGTSEQQLGLMVRIFTVALDSSAIFVLATIGRRVAGPLAGIAAAFLYVTLPIGVLPFSWGITSNLFGQYALLWVIALLVGGVPEFESLSHAAPQRDEGAKAQRWRPSWQLLLFLFFLTLTLLSHPGVLPLTALSLLLLWLARLVSAVRGKRRWRDVFVLAGAGALVIVIAFALYYRNVIADALNTYAAIQQQRAAAGTGFHRVTGGSVNDPSLGLNPHTVTDVGQWLREGIGGFITEAWVYYAAWPMLAFFGYLLLRRYKSETGARMLSLVYIWVVVAIAFAVFGLVNNLYVRYALYLMPMVAIGGGILLAYLWREQRGRYVALALGAYTIAAALLLWYNRIMFYQHG